VHLVQLCGNSPKFLVCNFRHAQLYFGLSSCTHVQFALSLGREEENNRQIQTRQKETNIESKTIENESARVQSVAACAEVPRLCSKYHISLKTCHSTQFPSNWNSNSPSSTGRYIWLAYLSQLCKLCCVVTCCCRRPSSMRITKDENNNDRRK